MNSIPCNIVITPEPALAEKAIALSRKIEGFGTRYTLKDGVFYPHISLYMVQFKLEDIDNIKTVLADIAVNVSPLQLTSREYKQAEAYIDAEYIRTDALATLQMAVVEATNPLRDNLRKRVKAYMLSTTGAVRENIEKYGYRNVGELFRPHVTFTRFTDDIVINIAGLPKPSELNGAFIKLGLFEMGDNGTCVRKIAEWDLAKSE